MLDSSDKTCHKDKQSYDLLNPCEFFSSFFPHYQMISLSIYFPLTRTFMQQQFNFNFQMPKYISAHFLRCQLPLQLNYRMNSQNKIQAAKQKERSRIDCEQQNQMSAEEVYSEQEQELIQLNDQGIHNKHKDHGEDSQGKAQCQIEQQKKELHLDSAQKVKMEQQRTLMKQEQIGSPVSQNSEIRMQSKQQKKTLTQFKSKTIQIDSKIAQAALQLLLPQLKSLILPERGSTHVNCSPPSIIINYNNQNTLVQAEKGIFNLLQQLSILPMRSQEAETGIHLSYKYQCQLIQQRISFFKDVTQKFKSQNFYICGRVEQKVLRLKLDQIKNTKFVWLRLFKFADSRSYRAILRRIFAAVDGVTEFVKQRYNAEYIEVAKLKPNFEIAKKGKSNQGVLIVLKFGRSNQIRNHQQMEDELTCFIQQKYHLICLSFLRSKQCRNHKYIPKIENVQWFFIDQKNMVKPVTFLFIIVRNQFYNQSLKKRIVSEIENMNIDITGRRFFKGFFPNIDQAMCGFDHQQFRIHSFPKQKPYSWNYRARIGSKFNWKETL